jgi:stage II sporulation protein D
MMLFKNSTFLSRSIAQLSSLKGKSWWLSLFICLFWQGLAGAAVEVRVAIDKNVEQVQVGSSTEAVVKDRTGKVLGELTEMLPYEAVPNGSGIGLSQWRAGELIIDPKDNGYVWIDDRWYRGRIRLIRQGKGLTAINLVDMDEYLYSVVGSEVVPTWPIDALKAQAIAARSFALYRRTQNRNQPYDLDPTTNSQVYKGLESETLSTQDAVRETSGKAITYNGKVILAVFHSSSGGHTENVEDVWSSRLPYLRGVVDYDQNSPVFQWQTSFTSEDLGKRIGGVGNVTSIIPEGRTPRGRVIGLRIKGDRGSKKMNGTAFRQALGLRSTLFTLSKNGGDFVISGRGYGHGIGMSQWGAYQLSQKGVDYQKILTHYYKSTRLTKIY